MLSAAGIGAILSPPTLGAAVFIIAEFLEISYLQVLLFATIPTRLSPFRVVLYATVVAFALGFLRRETRWTPRRVFDCLAAGTLGVLPVVTVCAAAGVIVAVVSLTGLGLKGSSLIVGAVGGTWSWRRSTRPWPC